MSAVIRALARLFTRPVKALIYPLLGWLIRRVSQRFASDIQPVEQLALQVRALNERQDKLEGIYWDRSALARRLAVIEDQLTALLLSRPAGEGVPGGLEFNSAGSTDHEAGGQPALRCVRPEADPLTSGPDEPEMLRTG
jgi:hypothetical protein